LSPAVALAALFLGAAPAAATPPPAISSIAEYVETFPTLQGGEVGRPTKHRKASSDSVEQLIQKTGGSDAAALSDLVASGPAAAVHHRGDKTNAKPRLVRPERVAVPSTASILGAPWRAFGGDAGLLAAVLGAATLIGAAARLRRRPGFRSKPR
jgi:hypothetical protein